jgi:hypothetical protein
MKKKMKKKREEKNTFVSPRRANKRKDWKIKGKKGIPNIYAKHGSSLR